MRLTKHRLDLALRRAVRYEPHGLTELELVNAFELAAQAMEAQSPSRETGEEVCGKERK